MVNNRCSGCSKKLNVGCWNMRSLVESDGSKILFGWLPQRCPAHGTRMRWRDRVRKDLKKFNIDERRWYQLAQDRSGWRRSYRTGLEDVTEARVAEDERRRRTRVEDSIENSGSSTATDKPYQCSVCVREHSDES